MNADVFFTMGVTHKVCQDYAVGKSDEKQPYIILSDGCSSAPDTDFGSRLLVRAAIPHMYQECFHDTDAFLYGVLSNAGTYCRTLGLPDDSLCATLLVAKVEDGKFKTICVGDGAVAAIKKDGTIVVHEYEFASGAPYYLRYELDKETKDGYFEAMGVAGHHRGYNLTPEVSDEHEYSFNFNQDKIYFENEFPLDDFVAVALFSDGVFSFVKQQMTFTTKQNLPVSNPEIFRELLSFKGYVGEFVHRRCNKAFKGFRERNIQNCDDVSVGVIVNGDKNV